MPTDAELQRALQNFSAAVKQAVTDAATHIQAEIADLKQQIANGGTVSQADLDAVAQAQADALAEIGAIDPANPPQP